jgi:hypothetical protein
VFGGTLKDPRLEIGDKHGRLIEATGYAAKDSHTAGGVVYWANHAWFFWHQNGVKYAASLHFFGRRPTRILLAKLVNDLRAATTLRP